MTDASDQDQNDTTDRPSQDASADQEAFVRWVREQHDLMARYAVTRNLVGDDAEGVPVWSIPHQVFVGRFYDKSAPQGGYWYIAGAVPSDHIAADVAGSAREALRHFAMKWQLQAAQIEQGGASAEDRVVDFANAAQNLARSAEALSACVENDAMWQSQGRGQPTSPLT